jgi:hypothetical protein
MIAVPFKAFQKAIDPDPGMIFNVQLTITTPGEPGRQLKTVIQFTI